jgi:hypothetical protein
MENAMTTFQTMPYTTDTDTITFSAQGEPLLVLSAKGMTYKGEFIEDGGVAHMALVETMRLMQSRYWVPTPAMIEAGAKAQASFQDGSVWPESWGQKDADEMRRIADKVWRHMYSEMMARLHT